MTIPPRNTPPHGDGPNPNEAVPRGSDQDVLALLFEALDLSVQEAQRLRTGLSNEDSQCRAEVEELFRTAEALFDATAPIDPPGEVLDRVIGEIVESQSGKRGTSSAVDRSELPPELPLARESWGEVFVLRAGQGAWVDTGVPGVSIRMLFEDPTAGRRTFLAKLQPGTRYPEHDHDGPEECLVLEGDLVSAGFDLRAGDYQRFPAGVHHGETRTRNGCLLLITADLN